MGSRVEWGLGWYRVQGGIGSWQAWGVGRAGAGTPLLFALRFAQSLRSNINGIPGKLTPGFLFYLMVN